MGLFQLGRLAAQGHHSWLFNHLQPTSDPLGGKQADRDADGCPERVRYDVLPHSQALALKPQRQMSQWLSA